MEQKCQNVHTNEVLTILHAETVNSLPKSLIAYVLSDGERWEESLFKKHWIILENKNE